MTELLASVAEIAGMGALTRETCDYHGPNVAAEFKIDGKVRPDGTRGRLTFCGHCTRHGVAKALRVYARPIIDPATKE